MPGAQSTELKAFVGTERLAHKKGHIIKPVAFFSGVRKAHSSTFPARSSDHWVGGLRGRGGGAGGQQAQEIERSAIEGAWTVNRSLGFGGYSVKETTAPGLPRLRLEALGVERLGERGRKGGRGGVGAHRMKERNGGL